MITETALITQIGLANENLSKLRACGFDIELDDFRDCCNGCDVLIVEPVACMNGQTDGAGRNTGRAYAFQFSGTLLGAAGIRIGPGMQLHNRRARGNASFDLRRIRIDEQRHANPTRRKRRAGIANPVLLRYDIETAFGRQFLAALRHQATIGRLRIGRNGDHGVGDCHFQIDSCQQTLLHQREIALLDMSAVFAQMNRDTVRAGLLCDQRCRHGIRVTGQTCLPQRCDMIDVDAQSDRGRCHQPASPSSASSRATARVFSGRSPS